MATINFPNNRDQLNPPLPTGALQDGDTTIINADGVDITYIFKKPGAPNTDSWWKSAGRVNNATPLDKIEEGNTSAEVIDTGTNGQFVVTTEGSARMKVTSDGTVKLNGTNIDTDPSIQLNPDGSSVFEGLLSTDLSADNTAIALKISGTTKGSLGTSGNDFIIGHAAAGTGNIALQTKPGSGTPTYKAYLTNAGNFLIGGTLPASPNTSLGNDGYADLKRQNTTVYGGGTRVTFNSQGSTSGSMGKPGEAFIRCRSFADDGSGTLTDVAGIAGDGSATFAGDVTVASDDNIGNGAVFIRKYGEVQSIRPTGSTSAVFLGANGGTQTSWIYADGSASFSGGVTTVAPDGAVTVNKATYGTAFSIQGAGTTNAFIQSDGDSYFNQAVKVGNSYADPAAAIYADGTASFAGTITLTDGGEGILFPAANTGNADPNTLDDYEEGTFTPALTSNGGTDPTQSYQLQNGTYTKIGNIVHINVWIQFADSGITPGSGPAVVNIPFRGDNYGGGSLSWSKGWAAEPATHVQLDPNAPKVTLKKDLLQNSADCSNVQNGLLLNFTVVYKIK